jgi:hypothetical protein
MELNASTVNTLQNFAGINPNVVVRTGNTIKTMTEARNVVASAKLTQEFPREFGIYDLSEFLSVINLVDSPTLDFADDKSVTISDVNNLSRVRYFYSDIDILTTPTNDVKMPDPELKFTLENTILDKIKRAATALGHNQVKITNAGNGNICFTVFDENNATSNTFNIEIPYKFISDESVEFEMIYNISNLKLMALDYEVSVSKAMVSHLENEEQGLEYWIALERTSKWG